ncbi:sulfotransferase [Rhodocaloribacter litoris]|uniref:sulfotransferase n=1 Tax=Rhodocaloribacter litoris TaxID=2558931 RepID=UPI00141F0262|nr:sulfotransferase [Rhodocaloribacter litoris]QXD16009.1 sulfotransferase [Rhodocaloribacter litoris]
MNEVFDPARDVTVVIPTFNRPEYFSRHVEAGLWNKVSLTLVDDGSSPEIAGQLNIIANKHGFEIHRHDNNQGVAAALGTGVINAKTTFFVRVDDDDYLDDRDVFLCEALDVWNAKSDAVMVMVPEMYAIIDSDVRLQYNRRSIHGKKGIEVLTRMILTGEMQVFGAGAVFRRDDVVSVLPEPFFKFAEDFMLIVRLCARYPDRRVYVTETGRYMRRIHAGSLSYRQHFSSEKALMHLVAMVVGGFYLEHAGVLNRAQLVRILLNRGNVLQQSYGLGRQVAAVVAGLLIETDLCPATGEAHQVLDYLKVHRDELPPEFVAMLSETGAAMLAGDQQGAMAVRTRKVGTPDEAVGEEVVFVGGAARSGTTLMETLLCQAPTSNPKLPEAHYLRCLMAAYRLAKGSIQHQVPQFFDSEEDFRRYNAGLVKQFIERTRARVGGSAHLVLKDPKMTKTFPEVYELLPSARFICMVRDPRDVVASLLKVGEKMLAQGRNDFVAQATRGRDLVALCRYLMAFYAPLWTVQEERFWDRMLFVRYEDLVQNPEGILDEVQEFTGLELKLPDGERLDTGTVDFERKAQNPRFSELYGKQVSRARVGAYAGVLRPEEVRVVEQACADFMRLFRYEPGEPDRRPAEPPVAAGAARHREIGSTAG